jgi:iron(III) transport system permease protein
MSGFPRVAARCVAALPLAFAVAFVAAFVLIPLGVMAAGTFFGPDGFTVLGWGQLLATEVDRTQMVNSLALGACATALATVLGCGHAWLTHRTDLPLAGALGPLGAAPLVIPPILVAMGFADLAEVAGFWPTVGLLGVANAPFVAVLSARGLRSIDGRLYEAALVSRGRGAADRLLARMIAPEVLAGALLAFIFVIGEHGVPEFLTVKGKTWHTYAEGIFSKWTRRNMGLDAVSVQSPIVASLPLVAIIAVSLAAALHLRGRSARDGDASPLPVRALRAWRWPALLLPVAYLGAGVGVPVVVMARWAAGSTRVGEPLSFQRFLASLRGAVEQAGDDLTRTVWIAALATLLLLVVAVPLARFAARRHRVPEWVSVLSIAVPAILLAIGMVKVFNRAAFGRFYDSTAMVTAAYAARFLPIAVLTLANVVRRIPIELEEAAMLAGRGPIARAVRIHLPLLLPATWSAACLGFILALRELDIAVVLPAGNGTVVRRLSNVVHFGGEELGGALALMLLLVAVLVPGLIMLITGRKLSSLS